MAAPVRRLLFLLLILSPAVAIPHGGQADEPSRVTHTCVLRGERTVIVPLNGSSNQDVRLSASGWCAATNLVPAARVVVGFIQQDLGLPGDGDYIGTATATTPVSGAVRTESHRWKVAGMIEDAKAQIHGSVLGGALPFPSHAKLYGVFKCGSGHKTGVCPTSGRRGSATILESDRRTTDVTSTHHIHHYPVEIVLVADWS